MDALQPRWRASLRTGGVVTIHAPLRVSNGSGQRRFKRTIAGFGDSFTANCHTAAATAYSSENYGYLHWAAALSGTAFAPYTENFGVGGTTTVDFLTQARMSAMLAGVSDVVLFPSVTNDRTLSGMTLAATKRNVMRIIETTLAAGKLIIVGTGTPRFGSKALPADEALNARAYRDWVLSYVSLFVPVVNIWDDYTEADTNDGLHPNVVGAWKIGSKFATVLRTLGMQPIPLPIDAGDVYSANCLTGALNLNPLLTGSNTLSTGSVNPVAGSVIADSMTAVGSGLTGVTTRWYKEPSQYGEAQCIELGGTLATAGGYFAFQPTANVTLSNLAAGDVIETVCGFEVSGAGSGILSWELELLVVKNSTTIYYRSGDKYQSPFVMPASCKGAHETQRYTCDGTETSIRSRLSCYLMDGVPLSGVVKATQYANRKVM